MKRAQQLAATVGSFTRTHVSHGPYGVVKLTEQGQMLVTLDGGEQFMVWSDRSSWFVNRVQSKMAYGADNLLEAAVLACDIQHCPTSVKRYHKGDA